MKLYNFRDIGGLKTKCNRETKPGLLFRTGNVAHWSNEAASHIANEHKIKIYVDFREPREVKNFGKPEALIKQKIEWMPFSINTKDEKFEKTRLPKAPDWISLYRNLFERNFKVWKDFAQLVATANVPILYGCLFGKDRTGIATSLILNALDVHDEHIAQDYAETTNQILPLTKLFQKMLENHGASEEDLFEHYARSHEAVILGFLEYIRTHPDEHDLGKELQQMMTEIREPLKKRLLK